MHCVAAGGAVGGLRVRSQSAGGRADRDGQVEEGAERGGLVDGRPWRAERGEGPDSTWPPGGWSGEWGLARLELGLGRPSPLSELRRRAHTQRC